MKYSSLRLALGAILALGAVMAQAATLNTGDVLTISAGVTIPNPSGYASSVVSGSYFGIDIDGDGIVADNEKIALEQGTTGLVIGVSTSPGASHAGAPTAGDTNAIDAPWFYSGNTGSDYVTTPVTGSTETGLDMSGWHVTWNGTQMSASTAYTWGSGYLPGVGNFSWDGNYGNAYTLDYHGIFPPADPSCFCQTNYALHLTGIVSPVPVPGAIWLIVSGLLGMFGIARKKVV